MSNKTTRPAGAGDLALAGLLGSRHGHYLAAMWARTESRHHREEIPVTEHAFAWLHPDLDGWRVELSAVSWQAGTPRPGPLRDSLWLDATTLGSPEVPVLTTVTELLQRRGWQIVGGAGESGPGGTWSERADGWWSVLRTAATRTSPPPGA